MTGRRLHSLLTYFIAAVWVSNGLFCKVLNLVPRHQQIVAAILGEGGARPLTVAIGIAEIGMAAWILSRIRARWSAVFQICVVGIMNVLEFVLVPDLLLWGRANAIFALCFVAMVYYHEFMLNHPPAKGAVV